MLSLAMVSMVFLLDLALMFFVADYPLMVFAFDYPLNELNFFFDYFGAAFHQHGWRVQSQARQAGLNQHLAALKSLCC
jgi:hypothetical protein